MLVVPEGSWFMSSLESGCLRCLWCSRFWWDFFWGPDTKLWGLFAVTLSKISRMEGIGFTKMWNETLWPTSHWNANGETHGTHLEWEETEGCWNKSMQGTLFLYSFPVRLLNFNRTGLLRSETRSYCSCDAIMQVWLYSTGSSNVRKRAEGTLQPYPFDGDLNRIDPDSPSFGSSTASVLRVKHGKDKGFERKTTRL